MNAGTIAIGKSGESNRKKHHERKGRIVNKMIDVTLAVMSDPLSLSHRSDVENAVDRFVRVICTLPRLAIGSNTVFVNRNRMYEPVHRFSISHISSFIII